MSDLFPDVTVFFFTCVIPLMRYPNELKADLIQDVFSFRFGYPNLTLTLKIEIENTLKGSLSTVHLF